MKVENSTDFFLKNLVLSQISNVYNQLGLPDSAMKYVTISHNNFLAKNNVEGIMLSGMEMARTYLKMDKPNQALPYIESSLELAKKNNLQYKIVDLYSMMGDCYFDMNKLELGRRYMNKFIDLNDSLLSVERERVVTETRVRFETAKKEKELRDQQNELTVMEMEKKLIKQKWYIIGTSSLALFMLLFHVVNKERITQKREKLEALKRIQEKNDELQRFAKQLKEKSEIVDHLSLHLVEEQEEGKADDSEIVNELAKLKIITDEDWIYFSNLFREIHFEFLSTISTYEPKLSEAELRLLMLKKLGFSNKHIANSIGVLPNTLRVTLSRLRKKLSLDVDTDLVVYMDQQSSRSVS